LQDFSYRDQIHLRPTGWTGCRRSSRSRRRGHRYSQGSLWNWVVSRIRMSVSEYLYIDVC